MDQRGQEPRWERVIRGQVERLEVDGGWIYRLPTENDYQYVFVRNQACITVMFREIDNDDDADDTYYRVVETVDWIGDEMPGEWISSGAVFDLVIDKSCTIKVIGDPRDEEKVRPREVAKPRADEPRHMALAEANSEQVKRAQEETDAQEAQQANGKDAEGEGRGDTALADADADRSDEQPVR